MTSGSNTTQANSASRNTGSTELSSKKKQDIKDSNGSQCLLCPNTLVQIAHIIAKNERLDWQVYWLRWTGLSKQFLKTDSGNLLCLCLIHRVEFDNQDFLIVPVLEDLQLLSEFEATDMARRVSEIKNGNSDPGRTVPTRLSGMCEYIFMRTSTRKAGRIGDFHETLKFPNELPQTLTYYKVPINAQMPTRVSFNNGRWLIDLRTIDINPFALIAKALLGVHTSISQPRTMVELEGQPEFVPPRVDLIAKELYNLRCKYNLTPQDQAFSPTAAGFSSDNE